MSYYLAYRDPRQIKRDVRGVVLCVAAFLITVSIVGSVAAVIAAFVENIDVVMAELGSSGSASAGGSISDDLYDVILDSTWKYVGFGSIVGMLCGLPWFFILRGKKFLTSDVTHTNSKVNVGTIALMLVFIFGIQFLMTILQVGWELLFGQNGGALTDDLTDATYTLATSFWGVLYVVIIGPICEELVFRGGVMRTLERYGANFAIIVSSLLFGLYHMIFFQSIFAFLVGLIFAYTAGRFSLKWAILLHMINNGLSVLLTVFGDNIVLNYVVLAVYAASFVVTIIVLFAKRKYLLAQKVAGAPSEPHVYARAFTSPWLIIYIVVIAIFMFMGLF